MQLDKQQILSLLQGLGDQNKVDRAQAELPDQVDTDQHAGLLDKLGINIGDLLGGGSGGPLAGIQDKLGL
ncbi:MAG TPA: hypothetical protein VIT65_20400 [Microlunatus sp.]